MAELNRWSPFEEMLSLRDAMTRLFEESYVRPSQAGSMVPALDLYETNDAFHIELVVPGVKPEDLDITIRENVLTISGEFKGAQKSKERNYHRSERREGRFTRTVAFPSNIKANEINARCENGLLYIDVPKAEEIRPRKIQIRSGQEQRTLEAGS